jgi:hypothetical protein
MNKLTVLAIVFLLLPVFSAGAASTTHRKHVAPTAPKARASAPAPAPTPPVTRLPIAPDTFRA